jgi:hypothetical protein
VKKFKEILIWLKKNERHLWTVLFVGGFATDVVVFLPAPLSRANSLFIIYLSLVLIGTLGGHYFYTHGYDKKKGTVARLLNVGFPFIADFFIGGLLSGLLIFYTKSSAITVSWPFILLLFFIFFGNELFRDYRKHLAFQLSLVFFTIYAYAIFSLPLAVKEIGPRIFIESGCISVAVFVVLLALMAAAGWKRLKESMLFIVAGIAGLIILINAAYFTGIIPPLPLTLTGVGAYESITHTGDSYVVVGEQPKPRWDIFGKQMVYVTSGSPLSVFSSVFAPIAFSSTIVHRWEIYDPTTHKWIERAEIAFLMTGGRTEGYRGYSTISHIQPGTYRVSIETLSGQVIGEIEFTVVYVQNMPVETTTTK